MDSLQIQMTTVMNVVSDVPHVQVVQIIVLLVTEMSEYLEAMNVIAQIITMKFQELPNVKIAQKPVQNVTLHVLNV